MSSDGKEWPNVALPQEGRLIYKLSSIKKHNFRLTRTVRKSSKEGKVLMEIMEQSGDDVDTQCA